LFIIGAFAQTPFYPAPRLAKSPLGLDEKPRLCTSSAHP
jgi:hypothetical protein